MLNKQLFILAHTFGEPSFYHTYRRLVKNQWRSYVELKEEQEKQLRQMITFAYNNIPYYRTLFKELKITPGNIRTIEDLQKLPILTKDVIKQNWQDFKPVNLDSLKYYTRATGGSTGTPFQYRISKQDRFLSGAILYRGWGYAGFELGDKMVILGGSSIVGGAVSNIETRVHEIVRNIKKLSSFDMGESEMQHYTKVLNTFRPKYIQGYASSIYFYAQWLEKNDLSVPKLIGVFTTAEKLFPHMRETIGRVFSCDVFDTYGLNDGGITAFECPEHSGLHIDTERSIMEVVDSQGCQMDVGKGQVIATSLHNYAMPFIRYATGDEVSITDETCNCGRGLKLLDEVIGRSVDVLVTPEGKSVHGWFFLYIFWEHCEGIKEYQVIQKSAEEILIKLIIDEKFNEGQLETIKQIIQSKSAAWDVRYDFVDEIERTEAGKYKFIVNELVGK
ncbi:capsular biosynthesis protein [Methanocalculus chunghsingensis]|uniref:Capsular biosynthesis protein n=1 Tax=Methanocalculus chunghsingensis TaxID=156457 RepID=A0A8J8B5L1_9EURY|nr:phenylacetate--CoA ligase family protein [Methanocalculus chunghsingensis]MBR1369941.1 capsular biosynthesis protein [Methanocalculus chunghsingensis]